MTTKIDYTAEEWKTLVATPAVVGLAVILAEQSQRRGRKQELAEFAVSILGAAAQYPDNELVQAVLPEAKIAVEAEELKDYAKTKQTDKALDVAVTWCEKLNAVLAAKCSFLEADGFKRFVLSAGLAVALTSADAEYLGIGGQKLSHGERKTLLKLVDVLDVDYEY